MQPSEIQALKKDIRYTLDELDESIRIVKDEARNLGVAPGQLRDAHGGWILHPLLIGKASALNAYIALDKE